MAVKMNPSNRIREVYRLKVSLVDSKPLIWRRFEVPGDTTLARLHDVLQIVMGWTDSHLHEFQTKDGRRFKASHPYLDDQNDDWDDESASAEKIRLCDLKRDLKEKIAYRYDFGDNWVHAVQLESTRPADAPHPAPVCLTGRCACPPEDCGGLWGYYDMLEAVKNPSHEDHANMLEWLGSDFDPDAFDVDQVNAALRELQHEKPPVQNA